MDTTNQNINPISEGNSEKTEKVKKAAAKTAQFAGAAGLGVAGTMAVNAMNTEGEEIAEELSAAAPATPAAAASEEVTAEAIMDFDPNDIMIEVVDDGKTESAGISVETSSGDVALMEPQPITGEIDAEHTAEVLIAEIEPYVDDVMYGGPDDWEDFDHDDILGDDDTLLADNDDVNDDLDLADDILS